MPRDLEFRYRSLNPPVNGNQEPQHFFHSVNLETYHDNFLESRRPLSQNLAFNSVTPLQFNHFKTSSQFDVFMTQNEYLDDLRLTYPENFDSASYPEPDYSFIREQPVLHDGMFLENQYPRSVHGAIGQFHSSIPSTVDPIPKNSAIEVTGNAKLIETRVTGRGKHERITTVWNCRNCNVKIEMYLTENKVKDYKQKECRNCSSYRKRNGGRPRPEVCWNPEKRYSKKRVPKSVIYPCEDCGQIVKKRFSIINKCNKCYQTFKKSKYLAKIYQEEMDMEQQLLLQMI